MKQNEEAMKYIHEAETLMLENDFYDQKPIPTISLAIYYMIWVNMPGLWNITKSHEGQTGGTNFLYCLCPFGICTYTNAAKQTTRSYFIVKTRNSYFLMHASAPSIAMNYTKNLSTCYEQLHQYHDAL